MALNAGQVPLAGVFTGDRQYVIPRFQRPYSWEFDDAYQLAEDLVSAWKRNDEAYFLGSIVLVLGEVEGEVEVIDGQQRLTTLSLLFAVLRDWLEDSATERAELDELLEIPAKSIFGVKQRARVKLRDRDQPFFECYVVAGDLLGLRESASEQRGNQSLRHLRENVDALQEALADGVTKKYVLEFLKYVLDQVHLVIVETDNYVNAHRIFGVLNTRGRPLAAADILKARVLGLVPTEKQGVYADLWEQAIEKQGAEPDAFFRHLLIAWTKAPSKRSLIEEFGHVIDRYEPGRGAEFIDNVLRPFADAYEVLSKDDHSRPAQERHVLKLLQDFQAEDWKSVAIWLIASVSDAGVRCDVLQRFERFYATLVVAKLGSDERVSAIVEVLRELDDQRESGELGEVPVRSLRVGDDVRLRAVYALAAELKKAPAVRKMLMTRAFIAAGGSVDELPRSFSVMSVLPTDTFRDDDCPVDVEHWSNRVGSLALVKGSAPTGIKKKSFRAILEYAKANSFSSLSPVSLTEDFYPLTQDVLLRRHQALVRGIAQYLEIDRDTGGIDLTALSEEDLLRISGGYGAARSRRTRLADVLRVGLVAVGDVFIWRRLQKGDEFRMSVTAEGTFRLPDGREVDAPSTAVMLLTESSARALDVWVREGDGKSLRDIWKTYEGRFAS